MAETHVGPARRDSVAGLTVRPAGSRVERLRASHSYGFVLAVVVASLLFAALAPSGPFATSFLVVLETVTVVVALWTSGVVPLRSTPVATLLGVAVIGAILATFGGGTGLAGALAIVDATLVGTAIAAIGLGAIDQGEVNIQSLRAAIAVYLLIGMFFMFLYGAVAWLGSDSFFQQGTDGTTALRFYFSFVTLATLGYGDYTPAGNLGHLFAIMEALVGQLYLVIVITLLVGNLGRKRGTRAE